MHAIVEALMTTIKKSCIVLFLEERLRSSTTSIAELWEHGPSELKRWKTSTTHMELRWR